MLCEARRASRFGLRAALLLKKVLCLVRGRWFLTRIIQQMHKPFLQILFLLRFVSVWVKAASSTSTISFCISDGSPSHLFYLTDLSSPLPGQSVVLEEYSAGRLVLSGGFLPAPRIVLTSASGLYSSSAVIDWNQKSHMRATEYMTTVEKLQADVPLNSSALLSVVPMGLAGSSNSEERLLMAGSESRHAEDFNILSWFFARPHVPRLWPTLMAAMQETSNGKAEKLGEPEKIYVSHIARFVISLHRFRVEVIDEEDNYLQSANLIRQRKQSRDPHPDMREGQLRADLPQAFISQIDYGHKLVVSANITIPVDPTKGPTALDDRIGHDVMRVVARDLKVERFQTLHPGATIFARFRWDPDVPPPLDAIDYMNAMKLAAYGEKSVPWNASLMMCPLGSYRRSRDGVHDDVGTCPPSDEWPSAALPTGSWVMRNGSAAMLKARVEQWRVAMTQSDRLAAHAVPLSVQVRRSPSLADTALLQDDELAQAKTATDLAASTEGPGGAAVAGGEAGARRDSRVRELVRERRLVSYTATRCLRSSTVPLALMMAAGDLAVFVALTLVVLVVAWFYLAAGFLMARLAAHVRLPPFLAIHTVPLRLHFVTLGMPNNT